MDFLSSLNPVQRKAVEQIHGAMMVIAGPGSGKTRVLTYRIAYMIAQGIEPFQILSLTFTNKAAKEMRERIYELVGSEAKNIWMGTFHSVFAKILRMEHDKIGFPAHFTIYDTDDAKSVIKQIVKELELNENLYKAANIFYRISNLKNMLITPLGYFKHDALKTDDVAAGRPRFGDVYALYAKKCFQNGAMDFDDLLLKTFELLVKHPDVLYKYQHKFRYILVDEYQDTNYAQYMIVKKLADVFQNICVVGDDAQSIYSFRGADISNILNFEKDYPEHATFKLEQNYRSTQHIVSAANQIISANKAQLPKQIWTDNPQGDKIKLVRTLSDNEEGKWVADAIYETQMHHQELPSGFAILYRTNAQSRAFEEGLRRANIPYRVYGGTSFYQRKEIKDLLAYLKLIVNHNDDEALRRIINYPARGIGKTTVEKAMVIAAQQELALWEVFENIKQYDFSFKAKELLYQFVLMIKSFETLLNHKNAFEVAEHVAKQTGLLSSLSADKTIEGVSRYENIQELLNGIKTFAEEDVAEQIDANVNDKSLGSYLQNIMLLTDADTEQDEQKDHVKLMTIHAAKGLEFNNVFVVGLEESLFPSAMSLSDREDLEEERRLFYVAVTRAKKRLFLTYATMRYRYGKTEYNDPSRFIDEIDDSCLQTVGFIPPKKNLKNEKSPEFSTPFYAKSAPTIAQHTPTENFVASSVHDLKTGMEIEHLKFGFGKIINIEGQGDNKISTIFFKEIGEKRIMLKYAKVRIINISDNFEN